MVFRIKPDEISDFVNCCRKVPVRAFNFKRKRAFVFDSFSHLDRLPSKSGSEKSAKVDVPSPQSEARRHVIIWLFIKFVKFTCWCLFVWLLMFRLNFFVYGIQFDFGLSYRTFGIRYSNRIYSVILFGIRYSVFGFQKIGFCPALVKKLKIWN